jgi:Tfp pilus assembly PilM family ATPase
MTETTTTALMLAGFGLAALGIAVFAALRGWQGWLDLKRMELAGQSRQEGRGPAMERIEVADLKERVRKLEAIASCVDL